MRLSWDEKYRSGEVCASDPEPLITEAANLLTPGRALDVACGLGCHSRWLAAEGWEVVAVDSSPYAIDQLHGVSNVNAVLADLEREFSIETMSFDLIIDVLYLQRDLFPRMIGGLRPGGILACVLPLVDDSPGLKPMNPAYLLNPSEILHLIPGLDVLYCAERRPKPDSRSRAELIARRPGI